MQPSGLYSDSGRLCALCLLSDMPMTKAAYMSVYGGLVPLGFSHSNEPATVYLLFSIISQIQDTLCYTEYYQPGKQVQILYETVAVRCKKSMF